MPVTAARRPLLPALLGVALLAGSAASLAPADPTLRAVVTYDGSSWSAQWGAGR